MHRLNNCSDIIKNNRGVMSWYEKVWTDFSEIFIDSYIISLRWEREGTWLGSHMTLCHKA